MAVLINGDKVRTLVIIYILLCLFIKQKNQKAYSHIIDC